MNRIIIDDIELTDCVLSGLSNIGVEYGFFDRTYGFTTSSEITLCKEGYELIYDKFFEDCQIDAVSKVQVYKSCCNEWFSFDIEAKDTEVCPGECQATIKLTKIPSARKCVNKLCRTFIGDLGYSDVATRHCVYYAIDRGLMQRFLLIFLPILTLFAWIIGLIVSAISLIISSVNLIPGINIPILTDTPRLNTIPCAIANFAAGTGQFHVGIKYKEVFEYYADQCGYDFKSTIFDHPDYRHLGTMFSTNTAGQDGLAVNIIQAALDIALVGSIQKRVVWYQENVPAKSIKDLMDDLADNVFNSQWIIKEGENGERGCIYFDVPEVIDGLRGELFVLSDIIERVVTKPCYSYIDNPGLAALRFKYCQDGINHIGDEMRYLFEGTKDFNKEDADWKTEIIEIQSSCHSANVRGMFDRKLLRQRQGVSWDVAIDKLRCGDTRAYLDDIFVNAAVQLVSGVVGILSSFLICNLNRKCDIIMSNDITQCQPLFIFDEDSPLEDTTIQKRKTGETVDGYDIYEYNYSLSFVKQLDDGSFECGQLFNQFWSRMDPNTKGGREILQMTDLVWEPTCEEQLMIHEKPCGWYITMPDGKRTNIDLIGINCDEDVTTANIDLGVITC